MPINKLKRYLINLLLHVCGMYALLRMYNRNKIPIIMYHNPGASVFKMHVEWFKKKKYTFITLDELVESIVNRTIKKLPSKSVVITIDDGHKGNESLVDICRNNRIKPTLYMVKEWYGSGKSFWVKRAHECGLSSFQIRHQSKGATLEMMDEMGKGENGNSDDGISEKAFADAEKYFDIQAHTCTHPILTYCDYETSYKEIYESYKWVRERFGKNSVHFSYPFGIYGEREVDIAREIGIVSARTTRRGWNSAETSVYELNITDINDTTELSQLEASLYNVYSIISKIIKVRNINS